MLFAVFQPAHAAEILILNGSGDSSLDAPLTSAGFTVVNGTLSPGQIAGKLTDSTVGVYIWNDGTLGNTGDGANPALAFNAADRSALLGFEAAHANFILDGLSWRANTLPDEQGLDKNEAIQLANAGGGIVLGADDASGAMIVQHVNQVASWFNLNSFFGVYSTSAEIQRFGGSFFDSPDAVDPAGIVGTTTYSEVPNGLQPNGFFLGTALFGSVSGPTPGFGSPLLSSDTLNGITYGSVNHLITTNIAGGAINTPIPEPGTWLICCLGLGLASLPAVRNALKKR